ncbi:fructokinase [Gracilibacillus orientalis]|uniref:Fructokinase n=1 Tax=Gracilibacillus orientalis TaxID=334253 RepID=A0A1I4HVT5_9BACI|nr:carbohydrate kinase [Gracilibacillus orientalis]SFL46299.1 fructokinase [Gracilibacillus orientalis]
MVDVTALGEILVDFTPNGVSEHGNPVYAANPGGAPGNLLVALSRLSKETSFIGSVGNDQFGNMLEETLYNNGVSTSGMVYSDIHTTLAIVHIDESGDRSFSFCRNPGADTMLSKDDLKPESIAQTKIFHVGSISMTNEPSRKATRTALKIAKENGVTISYDPNLRRDLWDSLEGAKERIVELLYYADIVKLSEEELEFIAGTNEVEKGAKLIFQQYDVSLLFITAGSIGSYCCNKHVILFKPGLSIKAIDTTGCGDAFFAGVLYKILENNMPYQNISEKEMSELLLFGNAMGAYVAQKQGGIPALPNLNEISKFISEVKEE